jgi:type II secretory pathway component GspD/PulD (secretin)
MKNIYQLKLNAKFLAVCAVLTSVPAMAQVVQQAVQTSAITFTTQTVETGPVLDVVPFVLSDGYTINLTLIPTLTEFNGYDTPPTIPNVTGNLNVVELPIVLPDFSVREVVTTVNVWDHQTVVLGGLISSQVQNTKDKVPVLGDIPLVGTLFQSQTKSTIRDNLMIFVTTTIVDPAGNLVHSEDELPFAQSSIPTQAPENSHISEKVETVHKLPDASND